MHGGATMHTGPVLKQRNRARREAKRKRRCSSEPFRSILGASNRLSEGRPMGHQRLGTLPATRKWDRVVALITGGADVPVFQGSRQEALAQFYATQGA